MPMSDSVGPAAARRWPWALAAAGSAAVAAVAALQVCGHQRASVEREDKPRPLPAQLLDDLPCETTDSADLAPTHACAAPDTTPLQAAQLHTRRRIRAKKKDSRSRSDFAGRLAVAAAAPKTASVETAADSDSWWTLAIELPSDPTGRATVQLAAPVACSESTRRRQQSGQLLPVARRATLTFYQYRRLARSAAELSALKASLTAEWQSLGLAGRVLLAEEGVNAQCSVPVQNKPAFVASVARHFPGAPVKQAVSEQGPAGLGRGAGAAAFAEEQLKVQLKKRLVADGLRPEEVAVDQRTGELDVGQHLTARVSCTAGRCGFGELLFEIELTAASSGPSMRGSLASPAVFAQRTASACVRGWWRRRRR